MPPKKNANAATQCEATAGTTPNEPAVDIDEQINTLDAEEQALLKQIELAEKKKKIQNLKAKLQSLQTSDVLPTNTGAVARAASAGGDERVTGVTLSELRAMEGLQQRVDQELVDLTGQAENDGSAYTGTDSISKIKTVLKSGKEAKATDNVKHSIKWPHTALKYNMGQKQVAYSDLDFASLVAGEITVINAADTPADEKYGRLELLKTTAYHSKNFPWQDVLNFHGTCLLEVEKGERTWGGRETFLTVETSTLYAQSFRATDVSRSTSQSSNRRWFCKPFQTGRCRHNGSHEAMVQGRLRHVDHICATCLQKENAAMSHAETAQECPHYSHE